jgi:hypothetical protein
MKELVALFGRQDGAASKTGLLYGAMIIVLLIAVVLIGVVMIIWAAQGELTPESARDLVAQLDRPGGAAGGAGLVYNLERLIKNALAKSAEPNGPAPEVEYAEDEAEEPASERWVEEEEEEFDDEEEYDEEEE